jgi:hypothetical protein
MFFPILISYVYLFFILLQHKILLLQECTSTCVRSPSEHKHVGISMYVCMHPSNVCMCPRNACIPPVTAAYATITSRLGVVVIRLLAAAFWLGVESRCYCRRKTDRRLNLAT